MVHTAVASEGTAPRHSPGRGGDVTPDATPQGERAARTTLAHAGTATHALEEMEVSAVPRNGPNQGALTPVAGPIHPWFARPPPFRDSARRRRRRRRDRRKEVIFFVPVSMFLQASLRAFFAPCLRVRPLPQRIFEVTSEASWVPQTDLP